MRTLSNPVSAPAMGRQQVDPSVSISPSEEQS